MSNKSTKTSVKLDSYEQAIEDNFDKIKPLSKKEKGEIANTLKDAATRYLKKNNRISIRIYGSDLYQLKILAVREGLPYQTLITSILHKYATGQLTQKESVIE